MPAVRALKFFASFAPLANSWQLDPSYGGPECPASMAPAREAASAHGKGDRGWDPCCFWDTSPGWGPCDLNEAVWEENGGELGKGTWCWARDWKKNGGTCKKADGGWDLWTGGFVYDHCPNIGSTCILTKDGDDWWSDISWTSSEKMQAMCPTNQAKPVCTDGGYILVPLADGSCEDNYRPRNIAANNVLTCWPAWSASKEAIALSSSSQDPTDGCLEAVNKYRGMGSKSPLQLCPPAQMDMAFQMAQWDATHGYHNWVNTKGWDNTCPAGTKALGQFPSSLKSTYGAEGQNEFGWEEQYDQFTQDEVNLCFYNEGPDGASPGPPTPHGCEDAPGVHGHYNNLMGDFACVACGKAVAEGKFMYTYNFCSTDSEAQVVV